MENFIYETMLEDISVCDELIDYHKNNVYEKIRGVTVGGNSETKKSTDVIVAWTQHPTIQKYVQQLSGKLIEYLEKYILKGRIKIGLKESFNIQHYAPNEGYFAWHCERTTSQSWQRGLVWMTYLNDVDDGGETEFFYQKLKIKPIKGKCVVSHHQRNTNILLLVGLIFMIQMILKEIINIILVLIKQSGNN